jgi:class 3 adenylate cyclase
MREPSLLSRLGGWWRGQPARNRGLAAAGPALLLALGYVPAVRGPLLFAWLTGCGILLLYVAGWGVLHPRSTLPAAGGALRWGAWAALAVALLGASGFQLTLADTLAVKIPAGFMLVFMAAVFAVFLPVAWAWGMCGVALGARFRRREAPAEARLMGLGAWWLCTLTTVVVEGLLPEDEPLAAMALMLSVPAAARVVFAWFDHRGFTLRGLLESVVAWLARRLVLRSERGGRVIRRDLRGPALGAWAALAVLVLGGAGITRPLAAEALVALIRFRNEPFTAGGFSLHWALSRVDRQARRDLVVVQLDPAARQEALRRSSEAAIQRRFVESLARWRPAAVVLPAPQVRPYGSMLLEGTPTPDEAGLARCRRDLAGLAAAIRQAGNVVLVLPPPPLDREDAEEQAAYREDLARWQPLRRAALGVGTGELRSLGVVRVPAVPLRWQGHPPAALVTAAVARGRGPTVIPATEGGAGVEVAGQRLRGAEAADGSLVVDFIGSGSGLEFPTLTYGEVVSGAAISVPAQFRLAAEPFAEVPAAGDWEAVGPFLRGKVVFLESLIPHWRDTPMGPMSRSEVLAAATATVLRGGGLRAPPGWQFCLWVLAAGALTGAVCTGRNPLPALWRAAAVVVVVGVGALLALRGGVWLDPVAPVLATLGALVLTSQLTVEVEREQRERNRLLLSRFAAPQVVDEWLDDPEFQPGLGGHRQQLAVLFADARGFTGFAETHSPEQVIEATNAYLTALTEAVHAQGGILDKYTGDGLMALFLTRGETPRDTVQRALWAALEMQRAASAVSEARATAGLTALAFGIGLHYGEAVVGFVGHPNRLDYTALGHTVVVSQRLQSIAGGGEVVVSEAVGGLLGGEVPLRAGDPVTVKGLSAPVVPYRLAPP